MGIAFLACLVLAWPAAAEPVKIRIGRASLPFAEEQLWLIETKPELAPHLGKDYSLEFYPFRGNDTRLQGFEAGAIDAAAGSANGIIFAAAQGLRFKIVASLSRESDKGFNTPFLVRADSDIRSPRDLKGKTLGINGFKSSVHLYLRAILIKNGLDPDRDVRFAPVRFPAQAEALRSGKIDLGPVVPPFAEVELRKGDLRQLFRSKDAVPFDEELTILLFDAEFLLEHGPAVRAFLSDLVAVTHFYVENGKEARQTLIDAGLAQAPADIYLEMKDYYRAPDCRIDLSALEQMQANQLAVGFLDKGIDVAAIVDLSYLPE